jgi:hypothetical protein
VIFNYVNFVTQMWINSSQEMVNSSDKMNSRYLGFNI